MKKIFAFFLLFFFTLNTDAQTYSEFISQAYSCAYVENDYQKAALLFDKAFDKEKPKSSELYFAAQINFELDSITKFVDFLTQSVNCGYANYYFLKNQEKYKIYFDKPEWELLLEKTHENFLAFDREYKSLKDSLSNYYKVSKRIEGEIDLRNDSLTVKHQGQRNTCSVFAATALIEYLIWKKYEKAIDMSEAYNYWAAKKFALTNSYLKDGYTSVDGLAGYLAIEAYKYGSMDEKNWEYENTNWLIDEDPRCVTINGAHIMECFTGVPPQNSRKSKFLAEPIYIDREDIGQYILQEKKPVAMNIFWYFDAVDKNGDFIIPADTMVDKGGHVILLVGYNSDTKSFIFQNSWGTNWGNDGYGTIPEDYIINYYEAFEIFPYGIDVSYDEKIEAIKASMGVSAQLIDIIH